MALKPNRGNALTEYVLPVLLIGVMLFGVIVGLDLPGNILVAMRNTSADNIQDNKMLISKLGELRTGRGLLNPNAPYQVCFSGKCVEVTPGKSQLTTEANATNGNNIKMLGALLTKKEEPTGGGEELSGETLQQIALQTAQTAMGVTQGMEVITAICGEDGSACADPNSLNSKIAMTYFLKELMPQIAQLTQESFALRDAALQSPEYCNNNASVCSSYTTNAKEFLLLTNQMLNTQVYDYQTVAQMQQKANAMCLAAGTPEDCAL